MDHYEVLGIRPNAGREEIELAFKGRRSQYHPDRYARSDAETQAWATNKMKEINEAYRVLGSAELRADFDRHRSAGKPGDARPQPRPEPPAQEKKDASSVLLNPKWEWFHDRVYARPRIPRKKLEGAVSSYAQDVSPDAVLVLLDDTLFGGAKEGMLVTSDAIYCKQKFESPKRIAFDAIKEVRPGTHSRVMVNGHEFFKAELIDHLAVLTFSSRLSAVFEQVESATDRPAPPPRDRRSGIDQFLAVHRGALQAIRERGAGGLLVDGLIARQMGSIADRFPDLRHAVERGSRSRKGSVEAECAEIALMIFLILHYYGYAKLPREFWEAGGDLFERVKEICDGYKEEFVDRFPFVFGRTFASDVLMSSNAHLDFDGARDLESKMSREEPLLLLLTNMGFDEQVARDLLRQFLVHAASWINEFFDVLERES